jgi:hypothetical protein
MQDSYAFDVGDFGKLGLLRHLIDPTEAPRLGVMWYATATPNATNGGKHLGYLQLSREVLSRAFDSESVIQRCTTVSAIISEQSALADLSSFCRHSASCR